jgi:hypothetical protein
MKFRHHSLTVCLTAVLLGTAPLYGFDGGYGSPDPSRYDQGSSAARASSDHGGTGAYGGTASGYNSGGWSRGNDSARDGYDTWRQSGGERWSERDFRPTEQGYGEDRYAAPRSYDERVPEQRRLDETTRAYDGYGQPHDYDAGYGSGYDGRGRVSTRDYGYGEPLYDADPYEDRYSGSYGRGFRTGDADAPVWRHPDDGAGQRSGLPERPRYRFRDDPSLSSGTRGEGTGGYDFRPLTERERERRGRGQPAYPAPRFPERDERYYGRDSGLSEPGAAFGYQPDFGPGSFYDRYYRSGP